MHQLSDEGRQRSFQSNAAAVSGYRHECGDVDLLASAQVTGESYKLSIRHGRVGDEGFHLRRPVVHFGDESHAALRELTLREHDNASVIRVGDREKVLLILDQRDGLIRSGLGEVFEMRQIEVVRDLVKVDQPRSEQANPLLGSQYTGHALIDTLAGDAAALDSGNQP